MILHLIQSQMQLLSKWHVFECLCGKADWNRWDSFSLWIHNTESVVCIIYTKTDTLMGSSQWHKNLVVESNLWLLRVYVVYVWAWSSSDLVLQVGGRARDTFKKDSKNTGSVIPHNTILDIILSRPQFVTQAFCFEFVQARWHHYDVFMVIFQGYLSEDIVQLFSQAE